MSAKNHKKKTFYMEAGLGNRLNCLYSTLFWCNNLNIKPTIIWKMEPACCARFEELFQVTRDLEIRYVYAFSIREDSIIRNVIGRTFLRIIRSFPSFVSASRTKEIFEKYGEKGITELLLSDKNNYIGSYDIFCSMEHFRKAIPLLQPSMEIKKRVDEIMSPYQGGQSNRHSYTKNRPYSLN